MLVKGQSWLEVYLQDIQLDHYVLAVERIGDLYCLVVTDDCSKFNWVFFLAYKDRNYEMLHRGIRKCITLDVVDDLDVYQFIVHGPTFMQPQNKTFEERCFLKRKREIALEKGKKACVTMVFSLQTLLMLKIQDTEEGGWSGLTTNNMDPLPLMFLEDPSASKQGLLSCQLEGNFMDWHQAQEMISSHSKGFSKPAAVQKDFMWTMLGQYDRRFNFSEDVNFLGRDLVSCMQKHTICGYLLSKRSRLCSSLYSCLLRQAYSGFDITSFEIVMSKRLINVVVTIGMMNHSFIEGRIHIVSMVFIVKVHVLFRRFELEVFFKVESTASPTQTSVSQRTAEVQGTDTSQRTAEVQGTDTSQGTAEVQGTDNSQGPADVQGTANFQGTDETQGAADIPKSPNDYTPTDASQTSGGDEGLWIYSFKTRIKVSTLRSKRDEERSKRRKCLQSNWGGIRKKKKDETEAFRKTERVMNTEGNHCGGIKAKDLGEEPKKKKLTLQQIRALETTNDEEVAKKIQAEWDAEEERKRLEELKKAKPKNTSCQEKKINTTILDRQDLQHLYRVVQSYFEHIPPTGLGLILLGDLTTIWETPKMSDDDFWKNQEDWEIISELMIRMWIMDMEVEDESEIAITLITFVPFCGTTEIVDNP
ncbi:hypothetical protein Tco_0318892 [Tanacetum coccineum]